MGTRPPFRVEHIGSLLRPPELLWARTEHAEGRLLYEDLQQIEDAMIRKAVAFQEDIGLPSITDGEYRRGVFYAGFLCQGLGGASISDEISHTFFVDELGRRIAAPLLRIHGRLRWEQPVHAAEFRFTQSLTCRPAKVTLPSPTLIDTIAGRNVRRDVYPDLAVLRQDTVDAYRNELRALAGAGCQFVQLDEVATAMYLDEQRRARLDRRGIDCKKLLLHDFPNLINDSIRGRPRGLHIAMHLCRGNHQSGWLAAGGYEPAAEALFNKIDADSYLLEFDTPRAGSFEPLRFVPKDKSVVLGLISSKLGRLESRDELMRRIEDASQYLDIDQMGISPQCGFASTAPGNNVTPDQQKAKLELAVRVADEVWGSAKGRSPDHGQNTVVAAGTPGMTGRLQ